jgi:hypothetical protein
LKPLLLLFCAVLSAQQAPDHHFRDGEFLHVKGADVYIRNSAPGFSGFFEVDSYSDDFDYIEIVMGVEVQVDKGTILRFETFTSPVYRGTRMSVGIIPDLEHVRTISIKTLKVKTEELFRR